MTGNHGELERIGERLLTAARTELYFEMRFMGPALMSLKPVMDTGARTIGTDAENLRYNPVWVMQTFLEHPYQLDRAYLHAIIHCLFRHMYGTASHPDTELWNLSCDIAAESVIDGMDYRTVRRTPSELREEWYRLLAKEAGVLTAERICRFLEDRKISYDTQVKLQEEFFCDDHAFWEHLADRESRGGSSGMPEDAAGENWKKAAERVESELRTSAEKAGSAAGDLLRLLGFELKERVGYTELLRHFAIPREECRVDPDSFDYGFYNYGMELYGNMPLIEENEYAENRKIRQLVIAIDTSASCDDRTVRRFLRETSAILLEKERFFRRFELRILECDAAVAGERVIRDADEMKRYSEGIELHGGGGTDFRPVFRHIDDLRKEGQLRDLSGLIYFTDGVGRYPKEAPPYETAFVFPGETALRDDEIPGWILRVYLEEDAQEGREAG